MEDGGKNPFSILGKIFIFPFLVFLLSGCSNQFLDIGLKEADKRVGDFLNDLPKEQEKQKVDSSKKEETTPQGADLSDEQKKAVDDWLEKNGYNRYGDSKGAIYAGGTPLFNEATGESIGRYDYILKKFPDILERIKKEK